MASLSYRRGAWELRYRDKAGRNRTERFPGRPTRRPPEEALDRQAAVERALPRGTYVTREERETTFGEYYARWRAARAKVHLLPYWGHWPLCDIRPSDVDDGIALLSRKMGPISVRTCYGLLRGPIRRAVKDRIIEDPLIDIALPPKPEIRKTFDDVLDRHEVARLVAAVPDPRPDYATLRTSARYQALVLMGCWLGPRWNEAIGVRVCNLNPLRQEITFGRYVVNQNGSQTFVEARSKTDDCRTVPVPGPVMDALATHLRAYRPDAGREDFLFLTHKGTHPLRNGFSRDILKPALRRADLADRRITWLSLRHTAASLMFDAGLTLWDVQRRLGHKSPTMTAEVYTHLMRERFEEGRLAMERYMRGAAT